MKRFSTAKTHGMLMRHLEANYTGYEKTSRLHKDIDFYYEVDFDRHEAKGWECDFPPWEERSGLQ